MVGSLTGDRTGCHCGGQTRASSVSWLSCFLAQGLLGLPYILVRIKMKHGELNTLRGSQLLFTSFVIISVAVSRYQDDNITPPLLEPGPLYTDKSGLLMEDAVIDTTVSLRKWGRGIWQSKLYQQFLGRIEIR